MLLKLSTSSKEAAGPSADGSAGPLGWRDFFGRDESASPPGICLAVHLTGTFEMLESFLA